VIRAENRGAEVIKDVVTEMKIADAFDAGPKLQNPQPGIESELPQRDYDA